MLYDKIVETEPVILSDLHMNYFAWGAAHYQERDFLAKVMF
jgi:hypothetical protein